MDEKAIEMAIDDVEAPIWPKPIGITSVVWGVLNTGCIGCGMANLLMVVFMPASMQQQAFPDGMPPTLASPPLMIWINYLLGFGLALALITAGVVLLLRKPIARPLHLGYGCVAIVLGIIGVVAGWQMQSEINEWCRLHPDTAFAKQNAMGSAIQMVFMVIAVLLAFAWPLFCLIWFGLVKRDSQEIARGVETLV